MIRVQITAVGEKNELVLPPELLAQLGVKVGDTVYLYEARDGGYRLSKDEPEFERQLAVVDEVMREDHDILVALAK
jgi:putative addiction module antidote